MGRQLPDGGRRLKALRTLLGDARPDDLADRINLAGLAAGTLVTIESPGDPRLLWDYEARAIAEAVGIPESFFTAPLDRLGDVGP